MRRCRVSLSRQADVICMLFVVRRRSRQRTPQRHEACGSCTGSPQWTSLTRATPSCRASSSSCTRGATSTTFPMTACAGRYALQRPSAMPHALCCARRPPQRLCVVPAPSFANAARCHVSSKLQVPMELLHLLAADAGVQAVLADRRVAEIVHHASRHGSMPSTRLIRGAPLHSAPCCASQLTMPAHHCTFCLVRMVCECLKDS